jgi:hypothetical protein
MIEAGMARNQTTSRRQRNPVKGIPAEEANLTAAERALLPDPTIVTEDDADAIVSHRRRNEATIDLNDILKRYGMERRRRPVAR